VEENSMILPELTSTKPTESRDEMPLTWGRLISRNVLSSSAALYLDSTVRACQTILVSGPARSGKTTLLNVLGASMGYNHDRVVVVERDFQLTFPPLLADAPSFATAHVARPHAEHLLHSLPRLRPDRCVIDDLVEDFAWHIWESIVYRCRGTVVSIKADGARDPVRQFAHLAAPGVTVLPSVLAETVAVVVQLTRVADAPRVAQILEVDPEYDGIFPGEVLFTPGFPQGALEWTGRAPRRIAVPSYSDWKLQ
jgi:Flp pilus assembly CpaF family ATPase